MTGRRLASDRQIEQCRWLHGDLECLLCDRNGDTVRPDHGALHSLRPVRIAVLHADHVAVVRVHDDRNRIYEVLNRVRTADRCVVATWPVDDRGVTRSGRRRR